MRLERTGSSRSGILICNWTDGTELEWLFIIFSALQNNWALRPALVEALPERMCD